MPSKTPNKTPGKPSGRTPGKPPGRTPGKPPGKKGRDQLPVIKPSGKKDDSFFEQVFQVARLVPKGRVTSYGAIGRYLGSASSARMVGWAMAACEGARPRVPAHRVVNSSGLLSGRHHFRPPERMEELLKKEGVSVKDHQVVDFKKLFWDPATELL